MDLLAWSLDFIRTYGMLAIFLLTMLENLNLPLPSEPVLLFAGYLVWAGEETAAAVFVAALGGTLCGACASYALGRWGRKLLDRHGRLFGATPRRVEAADRWMQRHGNQAVLYGRMVPLVRTFVSVAAGGARLPIRRYVLLTSIGAGAWIALMMTIGYLLNDAWEKAGHLIDPAKYVVLGALVLLTAAWVMRLRHQRGPGSVG